MKTELGARLRKCRRQKNLTCQAVGDALGYAGSTVRKWESGENIPSIDAIAALSTYYNVSMDWLWRGEEFHKKKEAYFW